MNGAVCVCIVRCVVMRVVICVVDVPLGVQRPCSGSKEY